MKCRRRRPSTETIKNEMGSAESNITPFPVAQRRPWISSTAPFILMNGQGMGTVGNGTVGLTDDAVGLLHL